MVQLNFLEKVGDPEEPGGSMQSMREQGATAYYLLNQGSGADNAVAPQDILNATTQILGGTSNVIGTGALDRDQPAKHPLYQLYARKINRQWGVGKFELTEALPSPLYPNPTYTQYALYDQYWFEVDFSSLPYAPAPNSMITPQAGSYYPETAGGTTKQTFTWWPEWWRWCDIRKVPAPSNDINLTQFGGSLGTYTWAPIVGGGGPTNNFDGAFQMQLPNSYIRVRWFDVPARYATASQSFFDAYRNRVNQNEIDLGKIVAQPGELLYLDWSPEYYTPNNPETGQLFPGITAPIDLMMVEFLFLYTKRTMGGTPATMPTNKNSIVGGHNLLPWFQDRKFYYAETPAVAGVSWPSYLSAPLELLWTDPDAPTSQPI